MKFITIWPNSLEAPLSAQYFKVALFDFFSLKSLLFSWIWIEGSASFIIPSSLCRGQIAPGTNQIEKGKICGCLCENERALHPKI